MLLCEGDALKMKLRGQPELYDVLAKLEIEIDYYEHPPVPTVEEASKYWADIEAAHCKNLFFRNHKGNRHYLVVLDYKHNLSIKELETRLRQGKLTFASPERMMKYLKLTPGSVTPLGLMNDCSNHVHLFLDANFQETSRISFHPCINTASIVLKYDDFLRFLKWTGNSWEYVTLY